MFQYLELLNARVHLFNQVPDAPGETHVEGWLLWMERSKFHMEEDRDGCVSFQHFQCFCKSHHYLYYWTVEKKKKKITFPCTDLIESIQAKLWHCFVHCLNQVQQLSMPSTHLQSQKGPAADKATMRNQSYILQMANWQLKELTAPRSLSITIDLQSLGSAHKPGNGGKKKKQLESTSNNIESDIWSTHWTLIKLILQKDGVGIGKPTFHL